MLSQETSTFDKKTLVGFVSSLRSETVLLLLVGFEVGVTYGVARLPQKWTRFCLQVVRSFYWRVPVDGTFNKPLKGLPVIGASLDGHPRRQHDILGVLERRGLFGLHLHKRVVVGSGSECGPSGLDIIVMDFWFGLGELRDFVLELRPVNTLCDDQLRVVGGIASESLLLAILQ
jgi:hypothetical protein